MIDIEFEDYCVAYEIFEPVFASTLRGLSSQETMVVKTVRKLHRRRDRAISVDEVAGKLKWKKSLVYKHVKNAVKAGLIEYEHGTRERNEKRLLPVHHATGFLPHPKLVLPRNREIGRKVKYVDPFTGKWKRLER